MSPSHLQSPVSASQLPRPLQVAAGYLLGQESTVKEMLNPVMLYATSE